MKILSLIVLGASLCASGCSPTSSTTVYMGSGSKWRWTVSSTSATAGTISGAESTLSLTTSGTYTKSSNGLMLVDLTTSSNPLRIYPGKYFALEASGVAFFMKPLISSSESQPLVHVAYRACPTSTLTGNWIYAQHATASDYSLSTFGPFGTYELTLSSGITSVTFPTSHALDAAYTSVTNSLTLSGTCSSSTAVADSPYGPMFLNSGGTGLLKTTSAEATLMLPATTIGDLSTLNGLYSGIGYDGSTAITFPISAIASSSGATGTINTSYISTTDLSTSAGTGPTFALTAVDTPSPGMIQATVTISSSTGNVACIASARALETSKKVIWCVGQSPSQNSKPFNAFLVSQ